MTRRGWLLFSTMSVLWGIPYLLIKVAVEQLSPASLVWGRTVIGAAVLLPIAAQGGHLAPALRRWRVIAVFTVIEIALPWLLLNDAERHLSSSFAGLLVATTPLVAVVLAALTGAETIVPSRLLGLAVGLAGVATLLGLDLGGQLRAGVEMAVVVVCYGTGPIIISRYFSELNTLAVMALAFSFTCLGYTPYVAAHWPGVPSGRVLLSVLGPGLLCTVAAFLVFFRLIAEVGPSRSTVITFVNPAVAVLLGIAVLGERFTIGVALGFPLILLGCWVATRRPSAAVAVP